MYIIKSVVSRTNDDDEHVVIMYNKLLQHDIKNIFLCIRIACIHVYTYTLYLTMILLYKLKDI